MRISDWSSDVCSSDLDQHGVDARCAGGVDLLHHVGEKQHVTGVSADFSQDVVVALRLAFAADFGIEKPREPLGQIASLGMREELPRSEEHTSELQSLMRISYAVFCLKKKKQQHTIK